MHCLWLRMALLGLALACSGCGPANAGPGGHPDAPGHNKLPAPEMLSCTYAGGNLTATWALVPEAAGYQVDFKGGHTEGHLSVETPPVVLPVTPGASLGVKVRALPADGSGPKGDWSAECRMEVPA